MTADLIQRLRDASGGYDDLNREAAAELARLTAVSNRGGHLSVANAEIERLTAENERLRADAERLDWMQSTGRVVWRVTHEKWEWLTDGSDGREKMEVFDGWAVFDYDNPHPTIRAAIDAARAAKEP